VAATTQVDWPQVAHEKIFAIKFATYLIAACAHKQAATAIIYIKKKLYFAKTLKKVVTFGD
jgi:hypothetical protein